MIPFVGELRERVGPMKHEIVGLVLRGHQSSLGVLPVGNGRRDCVLGYEAELQDDSDLQIQNLAESLA